MKFLLEKKVTTYKEIKAPVREEGSGTLIEAGRYEPQYEVTQHQIDTETTTAQQLKDWIDEFRLDFQFEEVGSRWTGKKFRVKIWERSGINDMYIPSRYGDHPNGSTDYIFPKDYFIFRSNDPSELIDEIIESVSFTQRCGGVWKSTCEYKTIEKVMYKRGVTK